MRYHEHCWRNILLETTKFADNYYKFYVKLTKNLKKPEITKLFYVGFKHENDPLVVIVMEKCVSLNIFLYLVSL